MTARTVTGSVESPLGGLPLVGARIVAELVTGVDGGAVYGATGDVVVGRSAALTDSRGVWTLTLEPNSLLTPAGTVWKVTTTPVDGAASNVFISVPDEAGPHNVVDLLAEEPGALPSQALAEHAALTPAHGAQRAAWFDIRDYGAVGDGATDDSSALRAAVAAAVAAGGGVVYVPPGRWAVGSRTRVEPNVAVRGSGMYLSVLYALTGGFRILDAVTEYESGSHVAVMDITLWGFADRDGTLGTDADRAAAIGPADWVVFSGARSVHSRQMGLTGVGYVSATATGCEIENCHRDGINLTGSGKATITGNVIRRCGDDAIAFHLASSAQAGSSASLQTIVAGNRIEKSFGVKLLGVANAAIYGNSGRWLYGYGLYLGASEGEGASDSLAVAIHGNSFVDVINATVVDAGDVGASIYIGTPAPTSNGTHTPGSATPGDGESAVIGKPVAGAWDKVGSPYTGAAGIVISGNTFAQTIDGVTKFSDTGFGTLFTNAGATDPAMAATVGLAGGADAMGVQLAGGGCTDALVAANSFYGFTAAVHVGPGSVASPNVSVSNNVMRRCAAGLVVDADSVVDGTFAVSGNTIDLDPLFESSERTTSGGQPTGGWTITSGTSAALVNAPDVNGVVISGNVIRNVGRVRHGSGRTSMVDNVVFCDPSSGKGVYFSSASDRARAGRTIWTDCDPRSTGYGEVFDGGVLVSPSVPTSGYYASGEFVRNTAASPANGTMTFGWYRLTTGNGHVMGSDWALVKVATV